VHNGPKVTVLVAAYNCPETLPTCLRALEQQSWKNLEVIVIDDHSPTSETFEIARKWAHRDPRFTAIRMPENGGAYIARNHGLSIATGKYVTLHDADDWSHPLKIETQIRYLEENLDVIACMGSQARIQEDLAFLRWSNFGRLVQTNMSSLMFRREPVLDALGYWDRVRFGGDSEFVQRLRLHFGDENVVTLQNAVHSFPRFNKTSIVASDELGALQLPYGVRRIYKEFQKLSHEQGHIKYEQHPEHRPFPVPKCMLLPKEKLKFRRHYDVIIISDFRLPGGSTSSNEQEIICQKQAGLNTGIL